MSFCLTVVVFILINYLYYTKIDEIQLLCNTNNNDNKTFSFLFFFC
jgi:hypothetical protein